MCDHRLGLQPLLAKENVTQKTIAVEPPSGWHGATTNQSVKALTWLKWQNHRLVQTSNTPQADRIKHAGNEGEVTVRTPAKSYVVDGFDPLTNTVYEFHGCLWHGCTKCFPDRHLQSIQRADRTFQELYEATTLKEKLLFEHGYNVVIIWECEWDRKVKTDEDLKTYISTLQLVPPLDPRDAFFGGRTNAATLYYKAAEGEQIRYVDVTSLYPWVNKNAVYPTGHPTIITSPEDQDISHYFGVAKVDILPPYELYHPVLPYRSCGKLVMPLCRTCVQEEMSKPLHEKTARCKHDIDERFLRGTWCTPEIMQALERGYQLIAIHEVWHFPEHQR